MEENVLASALEVQGVSKRENKKEREYNCFMAGFCHNFVRNQSGLRDAQEQRDFLPAHPIKIEPKPELIACGRLHIGLESPKSSPRLGVQYREALLRRSPQDPLSVAREDGNRTKFWRL